MARQHSVVSKELLNAREVVEFSTKTSVFLKIRDLAGQRGLPIGSLLNQLLIDGLEGFRQDSRTQDPDALIAMYESKEKGFPDGEFSRFGLRTDRKMVIKVRLRAGENEIDPVRFSSLLLIEALRHLEF